MLLHHIFCVMQLSVSLHYMTKKTVRPFCSLMMLAQFGFVCCQYRFCQPKRRNPEPEIMAFIRNPALFFFSITAFHDLIRKAAGNCCFWVKSCAFSYTHRMVAIWDHMFSIFDRNVSFLIHNILVKITCRYVELPYEPVLLDKHIFSFIIIISSNSLVSHKQQNFWILYSYKITSSIDFLLFINLIFSSYCLLQK